MNSANTSASMALPLVSILLPTHNRPDYAELALLSALAQRYTNIEIIVNDNSDDLLTQARFAPHIARDARIKYAYTPGCGPLENFHRCFERAQGEYINYLMDDDLFHPDKIYRMMSAMLGNPSVGMVTSFRQLIDEHGAPIAQIPGTERCFEIDTLIHAQSLGNNILSTGNNMVGEPTTVLFRRVDIDGSFGMFAGQQYTVLSDVATWLSVLRHKDCIYLADTLSYFRIHGGQDQRNNGIKIKANIDWLELFTDACRLGYFQMDSPAGLELLSSKLVTTILFLTSVRQEIANGSFDVTRMLNVTQRAIALLLHKRT